MRFFLFVLMLNYFLLLKEYVELPKHCSNFNDNIRTNIEIVLVKVLYFT